MKKALIAVALAVATVGSARAAVEAEAIPADQVQLYAPLFVQLVQQQFPNPAVKIDPAAELATGYHVQEQFGVFTMPDKNLTAKAVQDAGEKDVPVALVATKSLSVQDKDAVVPAERVAVANFNDMLKIPVFFVAVKGKDAERTLVVYSKDMKPLSTTVLKKGTGDAAAPLAVKLTNIDVEKKRVDLAFTLPGAYEGTVKLGGAEF